MKLALVSDKCGSTDPVLTVTGGIPSITSEEISDALAQHVRECHPDADDGESPSLNWVEWRIEIVP